MRPADLLAVRVRLMLPSDRRRVLAVERLCFAPGLAWSWRGFCQVVGDPSCRAFVAEVPDGQVLGHVAYQRRRGALFVINLAVHPAHRRRGVGRRLVQKVVSKLGPRRDRVAAVVPEGELGAQLFFAAQGFRAEAVLRGVFAGIGQDGYEMVYRECPGA